MAKLLAVVAAGLVSAALAAAPAARAEEAAMPAPKATPVAGPSAILQLLNRQSDSADTSLKESLRPDVAPVPASRIDAPERMPDGSVRYGKTRVNVKATSDCPDDPFHEALPPPPARRAR
jgi:hypothetical protein